MPSSSDLTFFFGAGASAPFGIPTMKQFVTDFEQLLNDEASKKERDLYGKVKKTLQDRLKKEVDLEAVFTVIDGILNYSPERLGFLSLYCGEGFATPDADCVDTCRLLKEKFQNFVRDACVIKEESFSRVGKVYHDFFNRFALELGNETRKGEFAYNSAWSLFTTNYDLCLEYYWREVAQVVLNAGFLFDNVRNLNVLRPRNLIIEQTGQMQVFKLHGSVDWLVEKETKDIIQVETVRGRSHMGRTYEGEMMIYPLAEKELYNDPFVSMLLRLNWELEKRDVWIVIGYSFNDPVIREIFIRKSDKRKHLILVHDKADQIRNERLSSFNGKVSAMEKKFGDWENFSAVNHQIIHKLKDNPRFSASELPFQ